MNLWIPLNPQPQFKTRPLLTILYNVPPGLYLKEACIWGRLLYEEIWYVLLVQVTQLKEASNDMNNWLADLFIGWKHRRYATNKMRMCVVLDARTLWLVHFLGIFSESRQEKKKQKAWNSKNKDVWCCYKATWYYMYVYSSTSKGISNMKLV